MILDDDGYGQVGGNGSVEWTIDVKNKKFQPHSDDIPPRGHRQHGVDANGKAGDFFTISLELPASMTKLEEFKKYLTTERNWKADGHRLAIKLRIEQNNPDQIQISWPRSSRKSRGHRRSKGKRGRRSR